MFNFGLVEWYEIRNKKEKISRKVYYEWLYMWFLIYIDIQRTYITSFCTNIWRKMLILLLFCPLTSFYFVLHVVYFYYSVSVVYYYYYAYYFHHFYYHYPNVKNDEHLDYQFYPID